MAGHQMFHEATVKFTDDFVNSLPRKLQEYTNIIKSNFKLSLHESEHDGYSCSGTIQNLARFTEDFLRHVSEEEKKAVRKMVADENIKKSRMRKPESFLHLRCPACEFTSKEIAAYRNHIRFHKASTDKKDKLYFTCDQCKDKKFETRDVDIYLRHVKSVHGKLTAVLCELCGTSFKRADSLAIHQLTFHGPGVEKRHKCDNCDKRFLRKAHLQEHQRVHNNKKEFSCEICSSRFKTDSAKQKHMLYKHTNPKAFKCDRCKKCCSTKANLQSHMKTHQKDMVEDPECEAQVINQRIAEHIQAELDSAAAANMEAEEEGSSEPAAEPTKSVVTTSPLTANDQQPDSETVTSQSSIQVASKPAEEVLSVVAPPSYPSRPASVTPQYTPFSESQAHHEDKDKDLDDIFPETISDEPEEPFDNQYVSKIPQEELDSVFRQDISCPDPHSQLSRPASVGSHHTESLANSETLDSLLPVHFRPQVSTDSAVPSPQSVCSSQYAHPSRPPSVTSQHSAYHDPSGIVPPYLQPQSYSLTQSTPDIVYNQSMSCANSMPGMQSLANVFDKPVSCIVSPNPHHMHYMPSNVGNASEHLIGSVSAFHSHLSQPSCFPGQYGAAVHYTNTSLPQDCVTIQSTTRCTTPQNFPTTPTFRPQTVDGRPIDVFTNLAVPTDNLLLPSSGPTSDVIPELHTPNKHFPDNESVVVDFSNILSYSSPS
ncbi:uncharacterized protein [Watersipora subatra]|uniref:uncharacterized protein n=1 Tax=Watersipora subatra TaxID=2589382 RepID=UPI00355C9481